MQKQQIMPTEDWYPLPDATKYKQLKHCPKSISYCGVNDYGAIYYHKLKKKTIVHSSTNHKWYIEL